MSDLLWIVPLWLICGTFCVLMVRLTVKYKRPARCPNCGRRPRWAFDFTPRLGSDLLRDHLKVCES